MNEDKIKELFSNEEYVAKLFESGSYEAASEMLAKEGVEATEDELKKAVTLLKKKANGELSDEELEECFGGTLLLGVAIGLGLGAIVAGASTPMIVKYNC